VVVLVVNVNWLLFQSDIQQKFCSRSFTEVN